VTEPRASITNGSIPFCCCCLPKVSFRSLNFSNDRENIQKTDTNNNNNPPNKKWSCL
jgi:hypothetical protein